MVRNFVLVFERCETVYNPWMVNTGTSTLLAIPDGRLNAIYVQCWLIGDKSRVSAAFARNFRALRTADIGRFHCKCNG